jgi:hypothetical protein
MKNRLIVFACVFILIATSKSVACSCNDAPNPPCRSYSETPLIFSGEVTDFVPIEKNPTGFENRKAVFKVQNVFKGEVSKEIIIYTGDGGSDCGFPFQVGKKYLVYAYGENDVFVTSYCTRTNYLADAGEDLSFFETVPTLKKGSTIFGSVKKYALQWGNAGGEDFGLTKPLPNMIVRLRGPKSTVLKTGKNGEFKVSGFPAGQYVIELRLPKHLEMSPNTSTQQLDILEVQDKSCVGAKFYVEFEGKISGKVLDANGGGVAGYDVQLVSADYKYEGENDTAPLLEWTVSRSDGSYKFDGIPPGRYRLGIGIGGAFDSFGKKGQVFYPNTKDPQKASTITITEGKPLRNVNLRPPRKP